ncbi:MAG: hypothetical protein ACYTF1_03115 [Planctomycetota bacterium]
MRETNPTITITINEVHIRVNRRVSAVSGKSETNPSSNINKVHIGVNRRVSAVPHRARNEAIASPQGRRSAEADSGLCSPD